MITMPLTMSQLVNWSVEHPGKQSVFISLPMSNREESDILNRMNTIFNKFSKAVKRDDLVMLNQYYKNINVNPETFSNYSIDNFSVWCLGDSLTVMAHASIVIFTNDFNEARGCNIEYAVCTHYGIPCTYESTLDNLRLEGTEKKKNTEYSSIFHTNIVVD